MLASAPALSSVSQTALERALRGHQSQQETLAKGAGNGTDKSPREASARAGGTELHALQRPLENQQSALPAF